MGALRAPVDAFSTNSFILGAHASRNPITSSNSLFSEEYPSFIKALHFSISPFSLAKSFWILLSASVVEVALVSSLLMIYSNVETDRVIIFFLLQSVAIESKLKGEAIPYSRVERITKDEVWLCRCG